MEVKYSYFQSYTYFIFMHNYAKQKLTTVRTSPMLLYGYECWTWIKEQSKWMKTGEKRFLWGVGGSRKTIVNKIKIWRW